MGRSELAAQQRMQLEAVLEEFENAVRNATDGNLPNVETYLGGFQGEEREYLEREMRTLLRDMVRGAYIVLNPLESGGMGSVSRVRHLRLGKIMALKEIRPETLHVGDREEILRRFQREIEACGRLDEHPNIVSYIDTGVNESGTPYLVMDYIDGEDLGKIVRRVGPLRIPDAAQVIHDAAIGLAHAHDHGLVHRDVKPSNIMVSRHGTVKILDFGLARITNADHHLTALTTGKVMGTFDYMSPELCRELTPDSRGDIYSLGCTLYFTLAGRAPYEDSKSQFEKMNAHLHAEPPPIPRLEQYPELRAILKKMLAKNPEDRYQEIHEVAEALRPFCVGADLRALVRSERPRSSSGGTSIADIRLPTGSREETASRITGSNAGDQTAEWTYVRKRRGRRLWLMGALVAVGMAILVSLLIADQWRRTQIRARLVRELGSLPGLNGHWWLDEAPWLLPETRLELVESLTNADEATREKLREALYNNPSAPQTYELLEQLKNRFRREWPVAVRSHLADVEAFDPEVANADDFALSLGNIANQLDSRPRDSLSGVELHLRGAIHHHLGQFDSAVRFYNAAAERYAQEEQPALRALCLLDWGELLHTYRQPARAHSKFRQAWQQLSDASPPGEPMPPLFELVAKVMEADSHRRIDNMAEAETLLRRCWEIAATLPEQHPLRAFVLERRAWLHLDNWRLDEAKDDFQAALAIRESHEPENHRARHFIYWDMQGVGMTQLYSGDAVAARRVFEQLIEQMDMPKRGVTKKQRAELEQRRPNLYERLADTALFSGAAIVSGADVDPARELDAAILAARRLKFAADGRKAVLIRLEYKAAAVRALRGDLTQAAQHRDEAMALEETTSEAPSSESDPPPARRRSNFALTKQVALATLDWRSPDDGEQHRGRNRLMELIAGAPSGLLRDDLLLLLYVGENLLQSDELAPAERRELAQQIRQLILAQPFPAQNPAVAGSAPRVPGVFQRYLKMAQETAAGKE